MILLIASSKKIVSSAVGVFVTSRLKNFSMFARSVLLSLCRIKDFLTSFTISSLLGGGKRIAAFSISLSDTKTGTSTPLSIAD